MLLSRDSMLLSRGSMRRERHPIGGGGEDCVLDAASRLEGVFLEELLVHRLKRGAPDGVGEEECNA